MSGSATVICARVIHGTARGEGVHPPSSSTGKISHIQRQPSSGRTRNSAAAAGNNRNNDNNNKMSYTSRTRNTSKSRHNGNNNNNNNNNIQTPRGVWMSPANGSPLNSPMKMPSGGGSPFHNFSQRSPARRLLGWRTLKEAIKDGTFTRWKSGGNLVSDYNTANSGLWSELHRQHPVQLQVSHDKENHVDKLFGQHVGIWFVIGEPFAKGGFGEVRFGYHKSMSAKKFAVKIEPVNHNGMRHLSAEYNIYSILGDSSGIPRCYYYGLCGIMHNALVMDLLGPSLDDVFESMKRKFTLRTVLLITLQAFDRLHYLHSRGVVHGDVKGENFLIGLPNEGLDTVIYIVDFGLSQVLKDHAKNVYLYNENSIVCPSGTPRYMSVSAHSGNALSFRDDLESLAYVLVYFLKGRLPWQGIHEKDASKKSAIIKARKTEETPENICSNCPEEFTLFLRYARNLRFQEEPDYEFSQYFQVKSLLDRVNAENDPLQEGGKPLGFDWIGKTFSFRKEPTRHPILPRAEFQKKISVPSLLPNEKLRLLHKQQSSAVQLTVRSAVQSKPVSPDRSINNLVHAISTPHVNQIVETTTTPQQPRHNLRVPVPSGAPSSQLSQQSTNGGRGDDASGLTADPEELVPEASSQPPNASQSQQSENRQKGSSGVVAGTRELTRQRKVEIVSPAPIRRSLLSGGSTGSMKVTTSPLARSTISATIFKFPGASLAESHSRTGETSLTDSSNNNSQDEEVSGGDDGGGEDDAVRIPSRRHSGHHLDPHTPLPNGVAINGHGNKGVKSPEWTKHASSRSTSTLQIKLSALPDHLQVHGQSEREMGTPRRTQPEAFGFPDNVFDSPSHMQISVTTPMGTLKHAKLQTRAMLPRSGLRLVVDDGTNKEPLSPGQTPESERERSPAAPMTPAGMQIMDPKALHRISVYDVKREGEPILPATLMHVGCFSWLKRRALCGARRQNRSVQLLMTVFTSVAFLAVIISSYKRIQSQREDDREIIEPPPPKSAAVGVPLTTTTTVMVNEATATSERIADVPADLGKGWFSRRAFMRWLHRLTGLPPRQ
ncbi:Casein kinase I isoform gamma-3 [Hypsibius exemplaris]|uniref:non-specific serine/threonine protein kinase n=1 Tax=Hypsibius exemplaris TaxID=2072580 RepID=A0A1W0WMD7_HYPEX|nr:Casein kinase I isoform gamma-3 [Hypsibius exemplaris]